MVIMTILLDSANVVCSGDDADDSEASEAEAENCKKIEVILLAFLF